MSGYVDALNDRESAPEEPYRERAYVSDLQDEVHEWANETFPQRTPAKAWMKLFEELGEVIKAPRDRLEWADVFIMLFDLASIHGVDVETAVFDKLEVNRARKWYESESGVYQHFADGGLLPLVGEKGPCG